MKQRGKQLLILIFASIVLYSCGAGKGSSSPAQSTSEQNNNPGNTSSTSDVDKCKEEIRTTIVENGVDRQATPSEIAQRGYEISQKCNLDEEELSQFLKNRGIN